MININQIFIGALVAVLLFSVFERKGEFKGKMNNIGRLLRSAFFTGFFCNEVLARVLF